MKIAFHTEQIDLRGTCVALYDYAHYSEKLLHNKSVIFTSREKIGSANKKALKKFTDRFPVITYDNAEHLNEMVNKQHFDLVYNIEYGTTDFHIDNVPVAIHCVFDCSKPHGTVYAAISDALARKYNHDLVVPHMIGLEPSVTKDNHRKDLGIPDNATVFGRYGGMDTFDLEWCRRVIVRLVNERDDLYFLFINTPVFYEHPRIKHLPFVTTQDEKNRFIRTTDAHLECGSLGHSFGLAMGEFSVNNKPIIAYNGRVWNTAHLEILKEKGIYYSNENEFYEILKNFKKENYISKNLNCYENYNPQKVMNIFKKVFIDRA